MHITHAKNTLSHNGRPDAHMAAAVDFVGHALTIWRLYPTQDDWKLQLRAALVLMSRLSMR